MLSFLTISLLTRGRVLAVLTCVLFLIRTGSIDFGETCLDEGEEAEVVEEEEGEEDEDEEGEEEEDVEELLDDEAEDDSDVVEDDSSDDESVVEGELEDDVVDPEVTLLLSSLLELEA